MQVFDWIEQEELLHLTGDLIRLESVNPPGREALVSRYISSYLKRHNINFICVEAAAGRENILCKQEGLSRRAALMFSGHMDVVPVSAGELTQWTLPPFSASVQDAYLYGRGSSDMKSGLAAMILAFIAMQRSGRKARRDILLAMTVDEEDRMQGSKALLKHPWLQQVADVVICEPSSLRLAAAGRGRSWVKITVQGVTSHGSQRSQGKNAIEMANILLSRLIGSDLIRPKNKAVGAEGESAELCKSQNQSGNQSQNQDCDYGASFWQPLSIQAGVEPAVVPDRCILTLDARIAADDSAARIWSLLDAILDELRRTIPGFMADYEIVDCREPWIADREDDFFLLVQDCMEASALPLSPVCFAGSTDGNIFRRIGIKPLIIGPGELALAHHANERVKIAELNQAAQLYFDIMLRA